MFLLSQDFTLDFYFRQFWTDPRLAYKKRTGVETLSVGSEFIKNIWVPDTFFVNEKQSYFHIATTSNEFIRIHYSGSITRSIRFVYHLLYTFTSGFLIIFFLWINSNSSMKVRKKHNLKFNSEIAQSSLWTERTKKLNSD